MIDVNSVLLEILLETVMPGVPGPIRAYEKYQRDIRRLLSEIVRRSDRIPIASLQGGRRRLIGKYFQFVIQEYRPRWVLLRPGIQRSHYQPYAVSYEYHVWWGLCLYWLGFDRQDEEAFRLSAWAFKQINAMKVTQQHPKTDWLCAFPLVERAVLARKEMPETVDDAITAITDLKGEADKCDDHATRQKMHGATAHLWRKLIGITDHAADKAEDTYEKADKLEGIQPRYLTYLHDLRKMSRSKREAVVGRPLLLALHARLPWLTYLAVLLCAVLCFLLLKPQSWRWFAELIQALLRSCGLSLAPMLLALFFLGIGVIAIGFGLRGFTTLMDGLSPTPEPDAGEPTRFYDIVDQSAGTSKPNVESTVVGLVVQDLGKDINTGQEIINNLYINMTGEILQRGETTIENDKMIGKFKIEGGVCSFVGRGGVGWLLHHTQTNAGTSVGTEWVRVNAGDQLECKPSTYAPLVSGRRYVIEEIENYASES